jgi:ankyrin repeat protein
MNISKELHDKLQTEFDFIKITDLKLIDHLIKHNNTLLRSILQEYPTLFTATGELMDIILYYISCDNMDVFDMLIYYNPEPNFYINSDNMGDDGLYLIHYLVINNKSKMLKKLVKCNIDINILDDDDLTAFDYACMDGNEKFADILIANSPIDITLSHMKIVCEYERMNMIKYLLSTSSDSDFSNSDMLHCAVIKNDIKLVKFIQKFKYKINNRQNRFGNTALHYACINNNLEIVKELLNANADVNILDNDEYYPIDYVYRYSEIYYLLLKHGAIKRCSCIIS